MPWWNKNLLSANLAVLLNEKVVAFALLPEIIKLDYFLDRSCRYLQTNKQTRVIKKVQMVRVGHAKLLV